MTGMKRCEYVYTLGVYKTDCGSELIFRPTGRCDKCGRKPKEKADDKPTRISDRASDRATG